MRLQASLTIWCAMAALAGQAFAVTKENVDEDRVPPYVLADPLQSADGARISTADEWTSKLRPEILRLFKTEVYGRAPKKKPTLKFQVDSVNASALGGKAVRKEVTIHVSTPRGKLPIQLLLYVPKTAKPAPVFLGLNFLGNQSVHSDPGISLSRSWILGKPEAGIVDHKATEASRGAEATRWQVEQVIGRGYAVATMCCGDIDPDIDDGFQNGVHPLFYRPGQTAPDDDEWGTIAAWAWGLSRGLDYLETDDSIDAKHVAVIGHSRMGKAALWAAATDPRFAMAISNESGCGGAALSKRVFGETVGLINAHFPHWFCRNFRKYNDREDRLPVDQHMLIALIAPRPVYVASAEEDRHADPRGEFLAARHAEPVYRLFGLSGVGTDEMPPVNHPIGDAIHYHIRTGKHDITAYDWQQYLAFAELHLRDKSDRASSKSN
jgi:hypothetical protein